MVKIESIADDIRNKAEGYLEEQLDTLKAFSEIDCGSGMIEGNQKVVSIVDRLLENIGAVSEHIVEPELGTHVVGRIKPLNAEGKIIINAHLDTVFHDGDAVKHPFHIEGDMAWGLGIADCKGGVVTPIYAIKLLQDLGLLPQKEIVMIFNCDEEVGSPSGKKLFEKEAVGAEAAYCFEPTRGNNGIITFRNGWGLAKIQVRGLSSHAFNEYEVGVSATQELANLIQKVYEMNKPVENIFYNVAPISGGVSNTIIADKAEADIGIAIPSNKAIDIIARDLKEILPTQKILSDSQVSVDFEVKAPPVELNENSEKLFAFIHDAADALGLEVPEQVAGSPADMNFFASFGVPVVDGMGPYMFDIHTKRERLKISSISERTALFAMTLALQRKYSL